MVFKQISTMVICSNLVMRGDLKVNGNVEFETRFIGAVRASGEVLLLPGSDLESNVRCGSLRVRPGALLKGRLQVGAARKPLSRLMSWFNKIGTGKL